MISFTKVPPAFRKLAQRYIKLRITTNSASCSRRELDAISRFLQFIAAEEPKWKDLRELTRRHVENFLVFYFNTECKTKRCYVDWLVCIKAFLERIQQFDYPDAPQTPAPSLLFYEDIPRAPMLSPMSDRVKYIPEGVMFQIKECLEHLTPSEYIPVVVALMASGWRSSDVLSLKYDTCLEYTAQGWYLHGDVQKTRIIIHRVPITDEVKEESTSARTVRRNHQRLENRKDTSHCRQKRS